MTLIRGVLLIFWAATLVGISTGSQKEQACRQLCGHQSGNKPQGEVAGRIFGYKDTVGSEERTSWESIEEVGSQINVPFVFEGGKRNVTRTYGSVVKTHKDTIQIGFI